MLARINRSYLPTYWDDFFNDSFFKNANTINCNGTSPAVNVIEDEKQYRIDVAVPGMPRNEFRIDLDDDVLTISSEKKETDEADESNKSRYMCREFGYSTFKRSFQLPDSIDQENIKASHDAGILSIQLPKKEEVVQKAPKQIEIS